MPLLPRRLTWFVLGLVTGAYGLKPIVAGLLFMADLLSRIARP